MAPRIKANHVLGDILVITADVVHTERNAGDYRDIATVPIPKRTAGTHPTAAPAVHPPRKGVPNRER